MLLLLYILVDFYSIHSRVLFLSFDIIVLFRYFEFDYSMFTVHSAHTRTQSPIFFGSYFVEQNFGVSFDAGTSLNEKKNQANERSTDRLNRSGRKIRWITATHNLTRVDTLKRTQRPEKKRNEEIQMKKKWKGSQ